MEGLRLYGAFRGQRRSTSTAERSFFLYAEGTTMVSRVGIIMLDVL